MGAVFADWSFWAVVVAAIAVVLSQLPPVHLLFKKAKLDLELYSKISVTHKVGNPNLQLHLLILNVGGRKVRIKDIRATIERDGTQVAILPAQNYLQDPSDQRAVLFTSFSLTLGQEWAHIVNFLNFFGREEEKRYRDLEAAMLADFREKRALATEEQKDPIELDSSTVTPFLDFFGERFVWCPGEYKLDVILLTDQESANLSKSFRFTLFESHSAQLRAITDYYKYGGGIWWDPQNVQVAVIVDVKEA
jgi:hypothetical protein